MQPKTVCEIYFSPSGTTKKVVQTFTSAISKKVKTIDLLRQHPTDVTQFEKNDLVVLGMPVFSGRIPRVCPKMLSRLEGNNTPLVIIAVYGNREYDDALVEMYDIMQAKGFVVVAAAAFIARHSIFPLIAPLRPDAQDEKTIEEFAKKCMKKLKRAEKPSSETLCIKGNRPYREIVSLPIVPTGDSSCNDCGVCVNICPVYAISPKNPRKTNKNKCIACMACVYSCTQKARALRGFMYYFARISYGMQFSKRKEPETFV